MASLYRHLLLEGGLISNDLSIVIRVLHSLFKVFPLSFIVVARTLSLVFRCTPADQPVNSSSPR